MAKVIVDKTSDVAEDKMTHITAGGREILPDLVSTKAAPAWQV
jgi:hypothetical protein